MTELLGLAVVTLIATAVGANYLARTYQQIVERNPTPAIRLINMPIQLDQAAQFPDNRVRKLSNDLKDMVIAHDILVVAVIEQFHLYPIDRPIIQRVCRYLGIEYRSLYDAEPNRKLLAHGDD